jgi:hypothetical protein
MSAKGAEGVFRLQLVRISAHLVTHLRGLRSYGRSMSTKAATPWGKATVEEELRVAQRAGDRRFETIVQLLEDEKGGALVRFAYSTGGSVRRGPVTLRARDLERLRTELEARPRLADALGLTPR